MDSILRYQNQHMKKSIVVVLSALVVSSCSLMGIHYQAHNPKKAKKYPKFTESDIWFGAMNEYRSCYNVEHYELYIDINPEAKTLGGKVLMTASATMEMDSLQVDLHKDLDMQHVRYQGRELPFERKYGAVLVAFPKTVSEGERFTLEMAYFGTPPVAKKPPWRGGVVWKEDKNKKPWVGVACETEGASVWWPCKDHTADEADSVTMHYTVPQGLVAVGNGRLTGKVEESGKVTYSWKTVHPVNTYNITYYAGDFQLITDSYRSGEDLLDLSYYVLPYNYERAEKHFEQAKDHIAFFESAFGKYPWYEDGYKLVESPYEGMEHQSAIAYGHGYEKNSFLGFNFDYIILHETAHEWWGNSVTARDLADVWLQEGFASYAEALYVEHSEGKSRYLSYMLFQRMMIKNKRPLVGPVDRRFFDYKDGDVYMKGSWVLHSLRSLIHNDSLFFDMLKTFAVKHKASLVDSDDFIKHVNTKTGEDYQWFFNQYLYRREAPTLEYSLIAPDRLAYRWNHVGDDFKMHCTLNYLSMQGERFKVRLEPSTKVQYIQLEVPTFSSGFGFDDVDKFFAQSQRSGLEKM